MFIKGITGSEDAPDTQTISLPVTPVIPAQVAPGETILSSHENQVTKALSDLWTDVQTLGAVAVPSTRKIIAGTGLTGGGDLTADRTFTAVPATVAALGSVKVGAGIAVAGDGTISVNSAAIAGGIQTPWLQNIDGNFKSLSNVAGLQMGGPFSCAGTASIVGPLTLNATLFATSSNNKIAVTCDTLITTGAVGINTTTPNATCEIARPAPGTMGTSAGAALIVSDGGGATYKGIKIGVSPSTGPYGAGWLQYSFTGTTHADLLLCPLAGGVGIGTQTTPLSFLDVSNLNGRSGFKTGSLELHCYALNNASVLENIYYDGAAYRLRAAGAGTMLRMLNGRFDVFPAVAGAADSLFSATPAFSVLNNANLAIGTIPASVARLEISTVAGVSNLKMGSLELYGHALNNSYLYENCFFNGTNYVYRAAGFANMLRILNGQFEFYTYASGAAGAALPLNSALTIGAGIVSVGMNGNGRLDLYDIGATGHMFKFVVSGGVFQIQNVGGAVMMGMNESDGRVTVGYDLTVNASLTVSGKIVTASTIQINTLWSTNPGVGSKQLWYDPADGNRVKYAP